MITVSSVPELEIIARDPDNIIHLQVDHTLMFTDTVPYKPCEIPSSEAQDCQNGEIHLQMDHALSFNDTLPTLQTLQNTFISAAGLPKWGNP
ncbi:hypothetical protein SK128_024167 [Halocaridina rubra]|uniref:Uncharacterized protein n=1 Tax=Halocaridina rubra TaxID=373956 RepID=A0AAN8XDX6_HALRR